MDVTFTTAEAVELAASDLGSFVARVGAATVYGLQVEEVPQPPPAAVAILNVTGWCSFADRAPAGVCAMAAGRDAAGGLLWACCLMAQPRDEEPQRMLESLLVDPAVLGRTARVAIRVSGGSFAGAGPA